MTDEMTTDEIKLQVLKVFKAKPRDDEDPLAFTKRVLDKALDEKRTPLAVWNELDKPAQDWVNAQGLLHEDIEKAEKEDTPWQGAEPDLFVTAKPDKKKAEEPEAEASSSDDGAEQEPTQEAKVETKKSAKKSAAKKTVAKKAAKKSAAPKKAAANGSASRGRTPKFTEAGKIKVLKDNPSRPGTVRDKAYKKFKNGMTVADALKAGVSRAQLLSHYNREIISISKA